ncbi:hypothetical protein PWT90_05311 [Aphanocladium album]|nr:hypothetical protein PWT90_05311 [Aphanocladium album]
MITQTETSNDVAASQRQKRWTPRVRTGCRTCRCRIKGVACEYAITAPQRPKTKLPLTVLQPPEWAFSEALRYYLTVTLAPKPGEPARKLTNEEHMSMYRPDMHISRQESIPSFVMMVTHSHIQDICKANKIRATPGAWPAISHLWRILFDNIAKAVTSLNRSLAANCTPRYSLFRIVDLLSIEMDMLDSAFWRTHFKGFLALVKVYGGVDTVIKSAVNPSPMLALQFVFLHGLICNTTGPVHDRIREFDSFTEDEILRIYSNAYFRTLPCPSRLFMSMVRISRLRIMAGTLDATSIELEDVAARICKDTQSFTPETWTEEYRIPTDPKIYTFARVFKAATILYGILSLPDNLSQAFCREHTLDNQDARLYWRGILLQAITEAHSIPTGMMGMCWPLAVLGASLHDSTQEEQNTVSGWLRDMELVHILGSAPVTLQGILTNYWASGKRGWENCFDRLYQIAA